MARRTLHSGLNRNKASVGRRGERDAREGYESDRQICGKRARQRMGSFLGDAQGAPISLGRMTLFWSPESINDLTALRAHIAEPAAAKHNGCYAPGRLPTKKRCGPRTSEVNKRSSAPKSCPQPARAAFNPAHMVNIVLRPVYRDPMLRIRAGLPISRATSHASHRRDRCKCSNFASAAASVHRCVAPVSFTAASPR